MDGYSGLMMASENGRRERKELGQERCELAAEVGRSERALGVGWIGSRLDVGVRERKEVRQMIVCAAPAYRRWDTCCLIRFGEM